jgi:4'-phosphopantetheinyl transferase
MNLAVFSNIRLGPNHPRMSDTDVHLWRAVLTDAPPALRETLSAIEWIRAARFHFDSDRERFIAARGILRAVLASYVDCDPSEISFTKGLHGKPQIDRRVLCFNLSHSEDLMLLAITLRREVGVDVEFMRDDVPFEMLADHFFAPEESLQVRTLPSSCKKQKFYEVWTSTEAKLKASGAGLGGTGRLIGGPWSVCNLAPMHGYAAAVAVHGDHPELTWFSYAA